MHLLMGNQSASRTYDFRLDQFSTILNFVKNVKKNVHKDLIRSLYTKICLCISGLSWSSWSVRVLKSLSLRLWSIMVFMVCLLRQGKVVDPKAQHRMEGNVDGTKEFIENPGGLENRYGFSGVLTEG